jgi:hypothetical protein
MGGFPMDAKFAVGDKADLSPGDKFVGGGLLGETAYAVDMEDHGTLRLCSKHTIVAHNH